MALSLNDLKKGKAGKASPSPLNAETRRMVRPWEDPTLEPQVTSLDQKLNSELPSKQVTNGEQTENKQVTNGEQTGNKQITKDSTNTGLAQCSEKKQVTEQVTSTRVNREQTGNKQGTRSGFEQLRGHEANLLQLIFAECQAIGELLTPPLTLDRIAESLESRKETAKTVIVRLTKKGLVKRENSATGRGGYTRFRLEKPLYQELLIRETGNKRVTNREQTGNKRDTQRVTERVTELSSSSSRSISNKELLTTGRQSSCEAELNSGWQVIDCSPLAEMRFGHNQISQIAQSARVTAEQLQESIYAFAFDLIENQKTKSISGSPLNYFMGILRRGPYTPPANYEAPEVKQMRLYLEAKEREQKARAELESRFEAVEFNEWTAALTTEEKIRLVPATDFAKLGSPGHNVQLKEYFRQNIWPERKNKVSQG